jgi:hypothetical protein
VSDVTGALLSSPRLRRRLLWLGLLVAVAAAIAAAATLMPTRSAAIERDDATAHAAPAAHAPAQSYAEPPTVPPPRAELDRLLDAFIPAVLAREDLAAGWKLVTADARGSRAAWMRGATPFQTFDARGKTFHGWTVNYSYPGDVGFDIFLPPKDPKTISIAFRGEAKRVGGAWRIAVFYPQATFQPARKEAHVWADTDLQPQAVGAAPTTGRLSAAWLLLPFGVVGAVAAAGVGFALVRSARRRSRVRAIRRELTTDRR